jgi:uncharacterized membrane protein
MNLPDSLLPAGWLWAGHLLYLGILVRAVLTAPWARLKDSHLQSVFFGSCVALLLLWSIEGGIRPGLHFHFLGVTALTLMFGWQFAVLAVSTVVLGLSLNGNTGWETFSWNVLLMGALPAASSTAALWAGRRWLPANFFVYVLSAFLGAAAALAVSGFAVIGVLSAAGLYTLELILGDMLTVLPLMILPEGLLNGMAITLMITYRPHWVGSFDDKHYLDGR